MDIHHAAMIHNALPMRVYEALIRQSDLSIWWSAPVVTRPVVGSTVEIQFDQGQRVFTLEIIRLEEGKLVQWRVVQPMWPVGPGMEQVITWRLEPHDTSTLVDLRVNGWLQEDGVYASVSYKLAIYLFKLKVYLGDTREIDPILPIIEKVK
jgi:uncharacterized protein YndB with AHSA1/START domain